MHKYILASSTMWLPHKPEFRDGENINQKVSDFIDTDTWQWDRPKLYETFAPRNRREILAIPLNRTRTRDMMIWKENGKHEFAVKSAYQVALGLRQKVDAEHSRAQVDGRRWKMIWKIKVPPKIKTFIWRACSNILPTRDNLSPTGKTGGPCMLVMPTTTRNLCSPYMGCPFAPNV